MKRRRKFTISPNDELIVEVDSPKWKLRYNLLDDANIRKIGIPRSEIVEVEPIFAIPGYLYEERGVAGPHHRLIGSACASFYTRDNRLFSIDDLFYFDENPKRSHFGGRQHWNHERRIVEHTAGKPRILLKTKHVKGHVMDSTHYVDISLDPGPDRIKVKKRVYRP